MGTKETHKPFKWRRHRQVRCSMIYRCCCPRLLPLMTRSCCMELLVPVLLQYKQTRKRLLKKYRSVNPERVRIRNITCPHQDKQQLSVSIPFRKSMIFIRVTTSTHITNKGILCNPHDMVLIVSVILHFRQERVILTFQAIWLSAMRNFVPCIFSKFLNGLCTRGVLVSGLAAYPYPNFSRIYPSGAVS
jgi:hypothetical protein